MLKHIIILFDIKKFVIFAQVFISIKSYRQKEITLSLGEFDKMLSNGFYRTRL